MKTLLDVYHDNLVKVMREMTPVEYSNSAYARYPRVSKQKALKMFTLAIARGELTLEDIVGSQK